MRTLIDIPEQILPGLMEICEAEQISRTEAVRRAISQYVDTQKINKDKDGLAALFGSWKGTESECDGVELQQRLRAEWKHRDPGF